MMTSLTEGATVHERCCLVLGHFVMLSKDDRLSDGERDSIKFAPITEMLSVIMANHLPDHVNRQPLSPADITIHGEPQ